MIRGFYTAASGLVSQQTNLNAIANNVSNVNTTGFKPQSTAFSSLMYSSMNGGAGDGNAVSIGNGVRIQQMGLQLNQGDPVRTGIPLDFAIMGEGFFSIENRESGVITYTRDGNFGVDVDRQRCYLVNSAGNYVLDEDGDRIELEKRTTTVEGKEVETGEWNLQKTPPGVVVFGNPYELKLVGGNQFVVTDASGGAQSLEMPNLLSGYLENSSVQLSQEMVKMIEASKGFSLNSRILQTADELEKNVNQLR